jgi:hypothetical protein
MLLPGRAGKAATIDVGRSEAGDTSRAGQKIISGPTAEGDHPGSHHVVNGQHTSGRAAGGTNRDVGRGRNRLSTGCPRSERPAEGRPAGRGGH